MDISIKEACRNSKSGKKEQSKRRGRGEEVLKLTNTSLLQIEFWGGEKK